MKSVWMCRWRSRFDPLGTNARAAGSQAAFLDENLGILKALMNALLLKAEYCFTRVQIVDSHKQGR